MHLARSGRPYCPTALVRCRVSCHLKPAGVFNCRIDTLVKCIRDQESRSDWEQWRAILCPTLVIFGERGMFDADHARRLVQELPSCQVVVIPGAGHDVHLDAPIGGCRPSWSPARLDPGSGRWSVHDDHVARRFLRTSTHFAHRSADVQDVRIPPGSSVGSGRVVPGQCRLLAG